MFLNSEVGCFYQPPFPTPLSGIVRGDQKITGSVGFNPVTLSSLNLFNCCPYKGKEGIK